MAAGAISAPLIIPISDGVTRKPKTRIDTRTPVCIQSDSPDVLIFFTLDGSKPVAGQRGSEVGSRKYLGPVLLPAGQVCVRAVAVSRDGRRSSVVTKSFSVGQVGSHQQVQSEGGYGSEGRSGSDPTPGRSVTCSPASEPDRTTPGPPPAPPPSPPPSRGAGVPEPVWTGSSRRSHSADPHHPMSSKLQTQRPRDAAAPRFPRCLCPSDPFARFCPQCVAVIPPVPPAGRGQLLPCPSCRCPVPVNSRTCWTCEASTDGSRATSTSGCGRRPVDQGGGSAPSGGPGGRTTWSCSSCCRLNRPDARFCDRCGTKAGHAPCWVTCWRCGAAPRCAACGVFLLPLAPPTACCDVTQSPASRRDVAPPPVDRATQTVGLYYPSATALQRRDQQRAMWRRSDRPLGAVSPGRGYWRNQLDHVCAHLRSHAQNRAAFRTLLAEPRLGRMVSALVQQNQDEVVLTLSFSLAAGQNLQVGPDGDPDGPAGSSTEPGRVQTLSGVTQHDRTGSRGLKQDADPEPDLLDEELCGSGF